MAVAMIIEVPGMTAAQYDAVLAEAWPNGVKPAGALAHVAGPAEGVWRVVDVWDSAENFQGFVQSTLAPALMHAGITVQPKVDVWPVHNSSVGA